MKNWCYTRTSERRRRTSCNWAVLPGVQKLIVLRPHILRFSRLSESQYGKHRSLSLQVNGYNNQEAETTNIRNSRSWNTPPLAFLSHRSCINYYSSRPPNAACQQGPCFQCGVMEHQLKVCPLKDAIVLVELKRWPFVPTYQKTFFWSLVCKFLLLDEKEKD